MEIVLNPGYKDPADGLDWNEQTPLIKNEIDKYLSTSKKQLNYKLVESNHGRGADWLTITLVLFNVFFAIPAFHKKLQETLPEWKKIYNELIILIDWISQKLEILFYPDELLFLEALNTLEKRTNVDELEFIGIIENSEVYGSGFLPENSKLIIYSFKSLNKIFQVGINNRKNVLFVNELDI